MKSSRKLLTEAELDVMTALWAASNADVRGVLQALPEERDLAYTTVATTLRILEEKGFVASTKHGRKLVYTPTLEREAYERRGVRHMVERLFGGDPLALVRSLVDADLSDEDLKRAEELLRDARRDA